MEKMAKKLRESSNSVIRSVVKLRCWTKIYTYLKVFCKSNYNWGKSTRVFLSYIFKANKIYILFYLLLKISKKQVNVIWHKEVHLKKWYTIRFLFSKEYKIIVVERTYSPTRLLYGVITKKNNVTIKYEMKFTGKTNIYSKRFND